TRARLAHQREVVVERQGGIVAALKQHGRGALRRRELDLGEDLVHRERPGLAVPRLAIEGAELAVGHADVGVIGIAVDHERHDLLGPSRESRVGGARAELEQRRVGEEVAALRAIETRHGRGGHNQTFRTLYRASRSTGTLPASRIMRNSCSRATPAGVCAPDRCWIRSSSSVPLTSSAPKCSAIDAVSSPNVTQYASMCGKLSSSRRDAAIVRRLSAGGVWRATSFVVAV